jgi:hypothetical protein
MSSLRTINTAEVSYATNYPSQGYAPNLSAMGPGACDSSHACLIDGALGCGGEWCKKLEYRFTIVSSSKTVPFGDYTATATPVDANNGTRNFCANADAVIRVQTGPPLAKPLTASECSAWPPVQ